MVETLLDEGRRLIEELSRRGFPLVAAFWLQAAEDEKWSFYLVSPAMDDERQRKLEGFTLLQQAFQAGPPLLWIDLVGVNIIGPSNPMARDALSILSRHPGPPGYPMRWRGKLLGNQYVEEAFIYLPPAAVPTGG